MRSSKSSRAERLGSFGLWKGKTLHVVSQHGFWGQLYLNTSHSPYRLCDLRQAADLSELPFPQLGNEVNNLKFSGQWRSKKAQPSQET